MIEPPTGTLDPPEAASLLISTWVQPWMLGVHVAYFLCWHLDYETWIR